MRQPMACFSCAESARTEIAFGLRFSRAFAWLVMWGFALTGPARCDDLWVARSRAVRAAVDKVAAAVVNVELVGVAQTAVGEVAADAPTVAVAVDGQGHFLASSMIVRGNPTSIICVTPGGRRAVAKVVAQDHLRQVVLLKTEADLGGESAEVKPLSLWDGVSAVGQTVIAVGRHVGSQTPAVATGILSGTDRNWGLALQTDARVSSAFYGGVLIDLKGRVLGVIVPMVPDGGAETETDWYDSGIAFAIPSSALLARLPSLIAGQDIRRGLLGIVPKESDPYVESTEIAAVRPRSPADRAGLRGGDVILSIDGSDVRSHREVKQMLGGRDAGDKISVRVRRGSETIDLPIELVSEIPPVSPQRLGIVVSQSSSIADASKAEGEKVADGNGSGLVVTGIVTGSPADGKLNVGDILSALDGTPVKDIDNLRRQVFSLDPDKATAVAVVREGKAANLELRSASIMAIDPKDFPDSLRYKPAEDERWEVRDFAVPDVANKAVIVAPRKGDAGSVDGVDSSLLGLAILLADPGETDLKRAAEAWVQPAQDSGMVVCLVAPAAEDRWSGEEIDLPRRLAAAIRQNLKIDPVRQVIGGIGKGSGASLAMAAAILRPGTFQGLTIRNDARPPGIRLRENEASSALQMWIVPGEDPDPPAWKEPLEKLGYPVFNGQSDPGAILAWGRSLAAI